MRESHLLAKPNFCERPRLNWKVIEAVGGGLAGIQRTQSVSTNIIEEIIWQSVSSTARVFIRQGDRFTLSRMELLNSRKKQIRQGDQVSSNSILEKEEVLSRRK